MVCTLDQSIAIVPIGLVDEFRRRSFPLEQYASWGSLCVRLPPRSIANDAIRLRRVLEKMIVMVRQALGMAPPAIPIDQMGEQGETLPSVAVVYDDLLQGIAPTGEVLDGAGKFKTQWAGHGAGALLEVMHDYKTLPHYLGERGPF
jgi:hypothetical protein